MRVRSTRTLIQTQQKPEPPKTTRAAQPSFTKKRLGVLLSYRGKRSLLATQACYPATAHTERFSLLCCQPEALFVSIATRTPQLTPGNPCWVHARQGHAISVPYRTLPRKQQFTNLAPIWVTEGHETFRLTMRASQKTYSGLSAFLN